MDSERAESAPAKELFAYFGFTIDKVVEGVIGLIGSEDKVV